MFMRKKRRIVVNDPMTLVGSKVLNVFMRGSEFKARAAGGGMYGSGETGKRLKKERKISET